MRQLALASAAGLLALIGAPTSVAAQTVRVDPANGPVVLDRAQCKALYDAIGDRFINPPPSAIPGQQSVPDRAIRWGLAYEAAQRNKTGCPEVNFAWPPNPDASAVAQAHVIPASVKEAMPQLVVEQLKPGSYEVAFILAEGGCIRADVNVADDCFATGWLHEQGIGTSADLSAAWLNYRKASLQGSGAARRRMAQWRYEGKGGIAQDLWQASSYAAELCRAGDGLACANYHRGVLEHPEYVGAERTALAAEFYAYHCLRDPVSLGACSNLAVMHFDPKYQMEDEALAKRFATTACEGGVAAPACRIVQIIEHEERARQLRSQYAEQRGGFGQFLADLARGMAAANAMGSPYSQNIERSSPSVGTDTNLAMQDWRDFNAAVRATNNIGTAYNSNCSASNPYC